MQQNTNDNASLRTGSKMLLLVLITTMSFGIYFFLDELYFYGLRSSIQKSVGQLGISHIIAYLIVGIPVYIGTIFIHGLKGVASGLGIDKPFFMGMGVPFLFTLPMLLGYALVFPFNGQITWNQLLINILAAAVFEELFFRGFLFGQLYRYTRLGFLPSVLLGALFFGAMHLYQSQELVTLIGVFVTTFLGAILFAWLFAEWRFNLWVPIFMHLFMNLFWLLFTVSDNAFGGIYANVFRIVTIALAICLTIVYKKKKRLALEINRHTVWMKRA